MLLSKNVCRLAGPCYLKWEVSTFLSQLPFPLGWSHSVASLPLRSPSIPCPLNISVFMRCPGPLVTLMCTSCVIIIRQQPADDSQISNSEFSTKNFIDFQICNSNDLLYIFIWMSEPLTFSVQHFQNLIPSFPQIFSSFCASKRQAMYPLNSET